MVGETSISLQSLMSIFKVSKTAMEIGQGDRNASNNSSLSADNSKEDPVVPVSIDVGKRVVKYDDKNRYKQKTSLLDNLIVERKNKFLLEKGNHLLTGESKV